VSVVVRLGRGLSEDNLSARDRFSRVSHIFFSFIFSYFMVRRGDE
jgi:hypothetical protein